MWTTGSQAVKALMKLVYHQATFDLLSHTPVISKRSLASLDRLASRLGIALPLSFKEWYSLRGAIRVLATYSNDDHPVFIDQMARSDKNNWHAAKSDDPRSSELLVFMHENQHVCRWAVNLTGADDPPVYVEVDALPSKGWTLFASKFSVFVYCQVWDWTPFTANWLGMSAWTEQLTTDDLTFMRERFTAAPQTYSWPGNVTYRFYNELGRVLIWEETGKVGWNIFASDSRSFGALAQLLCVKEALAASLSGFDYRADQVVKEMQSKR